MKFKYRVQVAFCEGINGENVKYAESCVISRGCDTYYGQDGCMDKREDCMHSAFSCLSQISSNAERGNNHCHIVNELAGELYVDVRDPKGNVPLLAFVYDASPLCKKDELWQVVVWSADEAEDVK